MILHGAKASSLEAFGLAGDDTEVFEFVENQFLAFDDALDDADNLVSVADFLAEWRDKGVQLEAFGCNLAVHAPPAVADQLAEEWLKAPVVRDRVIALLRLEQEFDRSLVW